MGKDRDKQRTKGNVKPSSSGRAAALVTRDGTMGFVGFGGQGASNLGYVPLTASLGDDVDTSVDADFRLVMRKLTKRDAVTKLKALQEFSELCKTSSLDAVEGAMPYWPRLFNKLAVDTEHRVREATQQAMEELVTRVGRSLAPHLKSVISIWLCAQYDTYGPVSSAALKSFQAAFTGEKQTNAIVFCREVLCEFVKDMLNQTPSTLSDPKFVAEEERESKFNRMMASSLRVLGHVMSTCDRQMNEGLQVQYLEIMEPKKFWKLGKHKSVHVRSAMFSLITTCCQLLPSLVISLGSQMCPIVLGSLDESEPLVCPQLWDAALSVLQAIPDCWGQVNIHKAVLPKLWVLLKKGGSGSAAVIYPSLLPFISKIPEEIMADSFCEEFFSSMHTGLHNEKVTSSPTEGAVTMTTYMECMKYCILRTKDKGDGGHILRRYLIVEQLLPLVKESMEPGVKMSRTSFYQGLSDLLSYLPASDITMATNGSPQQHLGKDLFEDARVFFWEGFEAMCMDIVDESQKENKNKATKISSLSDCLRSLKNPASLNKKQKKHKVMFTDSVGAKASNHGITAVNGTENEEKISSYQNSEPEKLYEGKLVDLICKICKHCIGEIHNKDILSEINLRLLSSLVSEFICSGLLRALLGRESQEEEKDLMVLCRDFLDTFVFPWLRKTLSRSELCYMVDIYYSIIRTFSGDSQAESLMSVIEINKSTAFFAILLERGVTARIAGVFTWLESDNCHRKIESLLQAHRLSDKEGRSPEEDHGFWTIIQLCMGSSVQGPLLNKECMEFVIESLTQFFAANGKSRDFDVILETLGKYFSFCENKADSFSDASEDILLKLFQQKLDNPSAFAAKAEEVLNSGLRAASVRRCPSLGRLFVTFASLILTKVESLPIDGIPGLADVSMKLLRDIHSLSTSNEALRATTMTTFHRLVSESLDREHRTTVSSWHATAMIFNHLPITAPIPEPSDKIHREQRVVLFASLLIWKIKTDKEWTPDAGSLAGSDIIVSMLLEAMWLHCWCMCVLGFKDLFDKNATSVMLHNKSPHVSSILTILTPLTENLLTLASNMADLNSIVTRAMERSFSHGDIWALVLRRLLYLLKQTDCGVYDMGAAIQVTVLQALMQDIRPVDARDAQGSENGESASVTMTTSESQTLVSLISRVDDIYTVKVTMETMIKWIAEEHDADGYVHAFALLASSLSRWSKLAEVTSQSGTVGGDASSLEDSAVKIEFDLSLLDALDGLSEWKTKHDKILLLNVDMDDVTTSELTVNLSFMRVLVLAILEIPEKLKPDHWDMVLCCLAAWLQTCEDNVTCIHSSFLLTPLSYQTSQLLSTVAAFFETNKNKLQSITTPPLERPQAETGSQQGEGASQQGEGASQEVPLSNDETTGYPPDLLTEWTEFFSGSVINAALKIFLEIADHVTQDTMDVPLGFVLGGLGRALAHTPVTVVQEYNFGIDSAHAPHSDDALPQWAQNMLHRCSSLLECNVPAVQITAYALLSNVIPNLASCYNNKMDSEEQEDPSRSPPLVLIATLEKSLSRMEGILQDARVKFGEHLSLADDSEAQTTIVTLILSSKLLISFLHSSSTENRVEYTHFLRRSKLINKLLSMLFRIMPLDKIIAVSDGYELTCDSDITESSIQDFSRSLYFSLCHSLPAMARQWFNELDKKQAAVVDKYTASSVTPLLCQREMQQVQNSSSRFDNMSVKARPVAGEVAAVYTVDEMSMELVVKLANNHPLGVVMVESGKKVGVTTSQWRSWMLQMTTFLTHQNGSIMDGLILWKRNADKHFEGVEDCMICFSVIHMSNYSLPKLSCRTCKKKFHSICLYRWFNTSNNSTCPLCRNIF